MERFRHEFVEFVPENLKEGVLYISMTYATAAHRCFCGCGAKVVTPITPTDWQLTYDGDSVSLDPSIGSWSLPCRSHYWLKGGTVEWAPAWTKRMINRERARDRIEKQKFYSSPTLATPNTTKEAQPIKSYLRRTINRFLSRSDS